MQRHSEGVWKFGTILFQLALERRKAIRLISKVDDELCQGLISYTDVIFELRAYLCARRCSEKLEIRQKQGQFSDMNLCDSTRHEAVRARSHLRHKRKVLELLHRLDPCPATQIRDTPSKFRPSQALTEAPHRKAQAMIRAWTVLACLAVVGEAVLTSQIPLRSSVSKPLLRLKGGFFGKPKDDANVQKGQPRNESSAAPLVERTGSRGMRMLRTTSYSALNEDKITEPGAIKSIVFALEICLKRAQFTC
jgi:hypothetical protein